MVFTNGDKTVGANISMDEITEFYYTEDASTDPPHFQRFRFIPKTAPTISIMRNGKAITGP